MQYFANLSALFLVRNVQPAMANSPVQLRNVAFSPSGEALCGQQNRGGIVPKQR